MPCTSETDIFSPTNLAMSSLSFTSHHSRVESRLRAGVSLPFLFLKVLLMLRTRPKMSSRLLRRGKGE